MIEIIILLATLPLRNRAQDAGCWPRYEGDRSQILPCRILKLELSRNLRLQTLSHFVSWAISTITKLKAHNELISSQHIRTRVTELAPIPKRCQAVAVRDGYETCVREGPGQSDTIRRFDAAVIVNSGSGLPSSSGRMEPYKVMAPCSQSTPAI